VNKEIYTDIFVTLGMRSERNAPKNGEPAVGLSFTAMLQWRTSSWFVLHGNAPAHRSVLVKDFFTKNSVTTLEHPPYSPDLAPAAFYLLFQMQLAL
jgi:hypothetical protein